EVDARARGQTQEARDCLPYEIELPLARLEGRDDADGEAVRLNSQLLAQRRALRVMRGREASGVNRAVDVLDARRARFFNAQTARERRTHLLREYELPRAYTPRELPATAVCAPLGLYVPHVEDDGRARRARAGRRLPERVYIVAVAAAAAVSAHEA